MIRTTTCEETQPFLAPYADGALAGRERASVGEHLLVCAECRAGVEAGRHVRTLLRSRAKDLETNAPPALKAWLAGHAASASAASSRQPRSVRSAPLSAAAALALAVLAVVAVGALAPRGTVLAAQLGLDHLKCLWLADRQHGVNAERLAADWEREQGWAITVPSSSPSAGLELVALRRCLYGDGAMAHLVYERDGRSVSLFILPRAREAAPELEIMGVGAVAWSRDGRTYALVGDVPVNELSALAGYIRPLAR